MSIYVLNENLKRVKQVGKYKSLTWVTAYTEVGNFTLDCSIDFFKYFNPSDHDETVFLENTKDPRKIGEVITAEKLHDNEGSPYLQVKGRMAENLLNRRTQIYAKVYTDTDLKAIATDLFNDNFISPADVNRKTPLIIYTESKQPITTKVDYELLRGSGIYDCIETLAKSVETGFRLDLTDSDKLEFFWYNGVDRTLNQNVNDRIVIEQKRGTTIAVDYYKSTETLKTAAIVDMENKDLRLYPTNSATGKSGLRRRETYFDLSSMSRIIEQPDGYMLMVSEEDYLGIIDDETASQLKECKASEYIDADMPPHIANQFRSKFYLGDIVSVKDSLTGYVSDQRVTVSTEVWSENAGYSLSIQCGESTTGVSITSNSGGTVGSVGSTGNNGVFLMAHPVNSCYETEAADEQTIVQMSSKYGGTWKLVGGDTEWVVGSLVTTAGAGFVPYGGASALIALRIRRIDDNVLMSWQVSPNSARALTGDIVGTFPVGFAGTENYPALHQASGSSKYISQINSSAGIVSLVIDRHRDENSTAGVYTNVSTSTWLTGNKTWMTDVDFPTGYGVRKKYKRIA